MKKYGTVIALIVLPLSGCIGLSPEQMKAMQGTSSSLCVKAAGWNGAPTEVHYASFGGKSVGTAGGGGEATCGSSTVKFDNDGKAGAAPPTVKFVPLPSPGDR